jgi:ATP-dependent protease ClpP protease subunit
VDIYITGQIGSGVDDSGNFIRGVELIDVISQVQSLGEEKEISVIINSPGGFVDVGDSIYNYLESLKSRGYKIKTVGDQLVGSIATKIFLVGYEREMRTNSEFFIHNPAVDPGLSDANKLASFAQRVSEVESNLRKFYSEKTGTQEDVLKPLMDVETSMSADQAVSLGFATKVSEDFKILAKINMNVVTDLLNKVTGLAGIKAMQELKLADGKAVVIEAEPGASPVGASVKVEGAPAPVGEHALSDGKILVVLEEGKVAEIKEAAPVAPVEPAEVEDKKYKELNDAITQLTGVVSSLVDIQANALTKGDIEAIKTDIKAQIKAPHVPAIGNGKTTNDFKLSPVQAKMRELENKRKQQLNSNK